MTADPRFWNKLAEDYAKKPVDRPEAFERKIAITKEHMSPGDVVLDIGCGTGSLALRLAGDAAEVHGLDLSSEMVRIARGKAEDQGVENVTFHVGPFDDNVPFEDDSLDGLCAYSILHLVPDRKAALNTIFRLLKPGGFFISSTVTLGDSWIPYTVMLKVMHWMGQAPASVGDPPEAAGGRGGGGRVRGCDAARGGRAIHGDVHGGAQARLGHGLVGFEVVQ